MSYNFFRLLFSLWIELRLAGLVAYYLDVVRVSAMRLSLLLQKTLQYESFRALNERERLRGHLVRRFIGLAAISGGIKFHTTLSCAHPKEIWPLTLILIDR